MLSDLFETFVVLSYFRLEKLDFVARISHHKQFSQNSRESLSSNSHRTDRDAKFMPQDYIRPRTTQNKKVSIGTRKKVCVYSWSGCLLLPKLCFPLTGFCFDLRGRLEQCPRQAEQFTAMKKYLISEKKRRHAEKLVFSRFIGEPFGLK